MRAGAKTRSGRHRAQALVEVLLAFAAVHVAFRAVWHGLACAMLPFGFLRERTGSVVAPAVAHGLLDVVGLAISP